RALAAARRPLRRRAPRPARTRLRPHRNRRLPPPVHSATASRSRLRRLRHLDIAPRRAPPSVAERRRGGRRVARRHTAAGRSRGGAGIQALRPARARLITALGAACALGASIAYVGVGGGRFATVGAGVGAFGLGLLVLGL